MDASTALAGIKIVPVVEINTLEIAVPLAETLLSCGINAIEITLRTSCALSAIEAVAAKVPDILVGAGSVRNSQNVTDVANAGANFLVSPGYSASVLDAVSAAKLPFVPGAASAAEIMTLAELGYNLVKFFPAEQSGGVAKLRALSAPLPETRFFPTGGINGELVGDYLQLDCVACVGGSWFVSEDALNRADYETIAQATRLALQAVPQ